MENYVRLVVELACAALFWLGGFIFLSARRDIMPPLLTISCALFAECWWALTMLTSVVIYHLGYGEKSTFKHIFGDGWGRGVWGLLAGLCLSTWALVTGHLCAPPHPHWLSILDNFPTWIWFLIYNAGNFTFENALKRIPQCIGDPIIGAWFASIVWIVR